MFKKKKKKINTQFHYSKKSLILAKAQQSLKMMGLNKSKKPNPISNQNQFQRSSSPLLTHDKPAGAETSTQAKEKAILSFSRTAYPVLIRNRFDALTPQECLVAM